MSRRPEAHEIERWRELTERALEAARAEDWPRVSALDAERSLALRAEPSVAVPNGHPSDAAELERRTRELIELDAELLSTVRAARTAAASNLGTGQAVRRASREYGAAASLVDAAAPLPDPPRGTGAFDVPDAASAARAYAGR